MWYLSPQKVLEIISNVQEPHDKVWKLTEMGYQYSFHYFRELQFNFQTHKCYFFRQFINGMHVHCSTYSIDWLIT